MSSVLSLTLSLAGDAPAHPLRPIFVSCAAMIPDEVSGNSSVRMKNALTRFGKFEIAVTWITF